MTFRESPGALRALRKAAVHGAAAVAVSLVARSGLAEPADPLSRAPGDESWAEPLGPLEPLPKAWEHQSEASAIIVTGNTRTETYNAKQTTSYTFGENSVIVSGHYRFASDQAVRTARNWRVSLRYERAVSLRVSLFVARLAESDIYAGTVQRDSTDFGVKYFFIKRESQEFFAEAGYRPAFENRVAPATDRAEHFGRTYLEWSRSWNENVKTRFWVEFLPNLKVSEDYLFSAEPSFDTKLNSVFALRLSYLFKYRGQPLPNTVARDTVYSTTLIANF